LLAVIFFSLTVVFKPVLFMSVFLSLSYPVSLTVGKLGINNLGISVLMIFSLMATALIFMRKNFSIEKKRLKNILPFLPIIIVVVLSSFYGFIRSGNDSLEMLVKFFVFGVFPLLLLIMIPFEKEVFLKIIDLTYYIAFAIFGGFTTGYVYFKVLNPSGFLNFFLSFDNPIGTSLFMMQFILITIVFLIFNKVSLERRVFSLLTILVSLFFVLSTFQRSFLVAILFSLFYYLISSYKISLKMIVSVLIFVSIFGVIIYNVTVILGSEQIKKVEKTMELAEKLSENKDIMRVKEAEELGTIGYRIIKIIASIKKIKERPYFGNGLGTFSNYAGYKYPHNIFIEFLYSSGFVGFLVFIFFMGYALIKIQLKSNLIKNLQLKIVLRLGMSFIILCFTILQFSGGVMNIFPYMFFSVASIFQIMSTNFRD
jgi:O-antigen ligase